MCCVARDLKKSAADSKVAFGSGNTSGGTFAEVDNSFIVNVNGLLETVNSPFDPSVRAPIFGNSGLESSRRSLAISR
jgi:hypothetical protein